jgi:hypothetical protein
MELLKYMVLKTCPFCNKPPEVIDQYSNGIPSSPIYDGIPTRSHLPWAMHNLGIYCHCLGLNQCYVSGLVMDDEEEDEDKRLEKINNMRYYLRDKWNTRAT